MQDPKMKLFFGVVIAVLILGYAHAQSGTICDGVPVNTFIRDVSRCDGWFSCTANGPLPGNCTSPYLFNQDAQSCDWPENVECFSCPVAQPIAQFPVANTCNQFILCINGVASQHVCTETLNFNTETGQCDLAENFPCEIQRSCPAVIPPGQIISFRDDTNCSIHWICAGSPPSPIRNECNPALHFDLVLNQCTLPHLTDCPAGTPAPSLPDNPGNGGGGPPGTTVPPPLTCPAPEGTFPHPATCSSFIICANNTPHVLHCAEDLHFSLAINNCDTIANANCSRP